MFLPLFYHIPDTNIANKLCEIIHDIYGNIFILFNNQYYWLTISNLNKLEFILIDTIDTLINVKDFMCKYNKIKYTNDPNSLKGKIINEMLYTDLEHENETSDIEDEENIYKKNLQYYPEEQLYYTENDNINLDDEDLEETISEIFNFSASNNNIMRCLDKTFETQSLYDTFIIDNSSNAIIFTLESPDKSAFRLTIHTNNLFVFNIVGTSIKQYKLYFNDENMLIFK